MSFRILIAMIICLTLSPVSAYGSQNDKKHPCGCVPIRDKDGHLIGIANVVCEPEDFPPPLPPPPKSIARLVLTTNAIEAEVWINGKLRGKTKENGILLIDLKATKAKIIVRHPDFYGVTKAYILKRGQIKVDTVRLVARYGKVVLGSIPENAQIFLDEVEQTIDSTSHAYEIEGIKREAVTIERVNVGIRKLRISHPNYVTWEGELEVKPFTTQMTFFAPPLKLATARLIVKALSGAKVYLDGVDKGEIPKDGRLVVKEISMRRQKPEGYEITVSKPGYIEVKSIRKLNIGDNGTLEVDLKSIPTSENK